MMGVTAGASTWRRGQTAEQVGAVPIQSPSSPKVAASSVWASCVSGYFRGVPDGVSAGGLCGCMMVFVLVISVLIPRS